MVKKPASQALQYKYEMYSSKMDHFKTHFKKYKNAYFQNRGFVTFKTFKVASNVNDIYCKAIKNDKEDLLYEFYSFMKEKIEKKTKMEKESKAKKKFRSVVMNKILKPKIQKTEEGVKDRGKEGNDLAGVIAKAANLVTGAADTRMKQKIKLMEQTVGDKVREISEYSSSGSQGEFQVRTSTGATGQNSNSTLKFYSLSSSPSSSSFHTSSTSSAISGMNSP